MFRLAWAKFIYIIMKDGHHKHSYMYAMRSLWPQVATAFKREHHQVLSYIECWHRTHNFCKLSFAACQLCSCCHAETYDRNCYNASSLYRYICMHCHDHIRAKATIYVIASTIMSSCTINGLNRQQKPALTFTVHSHDALRRHDSQGTSCHPYKITGWQKYKLKPTARAFLDYAATSLFACCIYAAKVCKI